MSEVFAFKALRVTAVQLETQDFVRLSPLARETLRNSAMKKLADAIRSGSDDTTSRISASG